MVRQYPQTGLRLDEIILKRGETRMRVKQFLTTGAVLVGLLGAHAMGQEKDKEKVREKIKVDAQQVYVERNEVVVGGPHEGMQTFVRSQGGGDNTFVFVSSEMAI